MGDIISFSADEPGFHEKAILFVDGKENCDSRRRDTKNDGVCALHTLNVYSSDYEICLALKGNQPLLYEDVQTFFDKTKLEGSRKSGNG